MKPTNADYEQLSVDIETWLKDEDTNDLQDAVNKLKQVAEFCITFLTETIPLPHEAVCAIGAIYDLIDGDEYYFLEDEDEDEDE